MRRLFFSNVLLTTTIFELIKQPISTWLHTSTELKTLRKYIKIYTGTG